MRSAGVVAALGGAALVAACSPPARIPPPPPGVQEVRAPDDKIVAASSVEDVRSELEALHLHAAPAERFFRTPQSMTYAAVKAHYAGSLTGWRASGRFPVHVRGGEAAAWTAGGRTFAFVLIGDPDQRTAVRQPGGLLITLQPSD